MAEATYVTVESVLEGVTELLTALGVEDADDVLLEYIAGSVMERIRNRINSDDIPEGLYHACIRLVTGEVLRALYSSGKLEAEGLDFSAPALQISEGKVNITMASGNGTLTADQKLAQLIAGLTDIEAYNVHRYRRLIW